jgi:hypothetical protein
MHRYKKKEATSKETGETSLVKAAPSELVEVHGLRLLESNDRSFSAKKSSADDPVVNSFLTFGRRHNLASSGNVLTGPGFLFGGTLAKHASGSDFLVVPWSNTGDMSEHAIDEDKNTKNELGSLTYTYFVNQMLAFISVPVAIFIDRNFEGRVSLDNGRDKAVTVPVADRSYHIFFPYFGGKDDMTALNLVLQLAENSHVTATVVHFNGAEAVLCTPISRKQDTAFFASHRASLPLAQADRVIFETVVSEEPVADVIARARTEIEQSLHSAGDLIVLGMNVARNRVLERKGTASTLGVLADRVLEGKLGASVLVVKA